MSAISQSALSTQYVQLLITIRSPDGYNPTGDAVAFAFAPYAYPQPAPANWYPGSWVTYAGPAYWAQVLVGPANGGIALTPGDYLGWVKITDDPEVPVIQAFTLQITP